MDLLKVPCLADDPELRVKTKTQPKRVVIMTLRIAILTLVAIVFLTEASQSHAEDATASPGRSPLSKADGLVPEASHSGDIEDESELQKPPKTVGTTPQSPFEEWPSDVMCDSSNDQDKNSGQAWSEKGRHFGGVLSFYSPWVSFDYMNTWLESRYLPPLVSTSPPGTEGVVPGAAVLFGGEKVSGDRQNAGKLSLGAWLGPAERLGVGGNFFSVQTETVRFDAASDGSRVLARPIDETSPNTENGGGPDSYLVTGPILLGTTPFVLSGDIHAVTQTDVLGAEGYLRYLLYGTPGWRLDLIGGYQFSRVDDNLNVNHVTFYDPAIFAWSATAEDNFNTVNRFHGGELGLLGEFGKGPIALSILAKVGLGNMNEVVTIAGRSSVTDMGGGTGYYRGGVLALPTNMGTYKQDKFAVIPETEIKLSLQLTRHWEATVGYDFIYWSTLALASDQIETSQRDLPKVNSSQWFGGQLDPAGGAYPSCTGIKDSSLWLQGLSVGLTLRI